MSDHSVFLSTIQPALRRRGTTFERFLQDADIDALLSRAGDPFMKILHAEQGGRLSKSSNKRETPSQSNKGKKKHKLNVAPNSTVQQQQPKPLLPGAVKDVSPLDVVFGRGNCVARFHGNWLFRQLIGLNKAAYAKMFKEEKGRASDALIWHFEQVGSRFLEASGDGFALVDYPRVYEKFCQGLREKKYALSGLVPQVVHILRKKGGKDKVAKSLTRNIKRKKKYSASYREDSDAERGLKKQKINHKKMPSKAKAATTRANAGTTAEIPPASSVKTSLTQPAKKTKATKTPAKAPKLKKTTSASASPGKSNPAQRFSTTPIAHDLLVSPSQNNAAVVTPSVDAATVSLGSDDKNETKSPSGLAYQKPGSVKALEISNSKKLKEEDRAIFQAFCESFRDSMMYAQETMKEHWHVKTKGVSTDPKTEYLVHALRPSKLRKFQPGSTMIPLPVFHDYDQDSKRQSLVERRFVVDSATSDDEDLS